MRLLLLTGLLLLQFFLAPGKGAAAPARSSGKGNPAEARLYATSPGAHPAAWSLCPAQGLKTATPLRQHLPLGSLPTETTSLHQQQAVGHPLVRLAKEVRVIPISLRLLFPRHYFW